MPRVSENKSGPSMAIPFSPNSPKRSELHSRRLNHAVLGLRAIHSNFIPTGIRFICPRFPSFLCRPVHRQCLAQRSWLRWHHRSRLCRPPFPGGDASPRAPLPPVFPTLGIPANAREETGGSNRADRNFGNTIVFLLAHELGHALRKHRTHLRDPGEQRTQEIEADKFAIEMMRRIGQLPQGLEFWFNVEQGIRRVAGKLSDKAGGRKTSRRSGTPGDERKADGPRGCNREGPESFARNQTNQALWTSQ